MLLRAGRRTALLKVLGALCAVTLVISIASLLQYENVFSRGYDYDELPEAPAFSLNLYRQFFDYLETPLAACRQLGRFSRRTGWEEPALCLSEPVDMWRVTDCLVYSVRHTNDSDDDAFEQGMAEELGCEVHLIDLTGRRGPTSHVQLGDGSVTYHRLSSGRQYQRLPELVTRLGHTERLIHHLRVTADFSAHAASRLPAALRSLTDSDPDELELLAGQVMQLQLALTLRPASLSQPALEAYRRAWQLLADLHRRGFSVLESRNSGRVVWLPGLGRQVAASYNLLLAKHMPLAARRSALLNRSANESARSPQQVHMFAP
ncbi:uncharacterized protein LOC122370237 [Amphibalanus amphitrite]|uniref:uncharacterized protein LOC122370237 n=1 Tax=Amphibalanus amphitrite TaxID=1232801 RepID=UPI001C91A687|nr:uncharacterized protein LOC122370237 [Amphibalanus amphitrite]